MIKRGRNEWCYLIPKNLFFGKAVLLVFTFFFTVQVWSQRLDIGIMRGFSVSSVQFSFGDGEYEFLSDSNLICKLTKADKITLTRQGPGIRFDKNGISMGTYTSVYIHELTKNSCLTMQCLLPVSKKVRKYRNDFRVHTEGTEKLKIINEVEMENYLAGVIESEGGGGKHAEYYKVQAVLSRTYALDHLTKHFKDGFQLCDEVHCQAYLSMMRFTPAIQQAVHATNGVIMIGPDFKLADGFFFANCGGQTSESDFVWNVSVPYCKSVRDTFCIHSKQATWEKRIPQSKWQNYLVEQFGFPLTDSLLSSVMFYFDQPVRTAFYISPHLGIPLRDLREEFKLKSTWFSCYPEGEELVLKGRGFGHGVGLCQEGAMRMAVLGYQYEQILRFYFTGIELFDYSQWAFLRQKSSDAYTL
ncbi:MAG: SpoIID/LytB domain-containing protein [Bacteroidetes bacterium]|nr:SpoIID/LytB domain-containing protein [Bacteroidota bacterium]